MAKKANKEVVPTAEVVRKGLLELAAADGPRRLSGKGDHPAVFEAKGAGKDAATHALNGAEPLVVVSGGGKKESVTLTAVGLLLVADGIPEDRIGPLVGGVAGTLAPTERIAFLERVVETAPAARAALLPLLEVAAADERAERAARAERDARRHAAEVAGIAAAERWVAVTRQRHADEVADLTARMAVLRGGDIMPSPSRPRPEPATKEDIGFRRDVANQLVSSWRETWKPDRPDVRDFLESAMWNIRGFETIGEVGEAIGFDNRVHACEVGVSAGNPVRVVRPGWKLREGEAAEYVVQKAAVEPRG